MEKPSTPYIPWVEFPIASTESLKAKTIPFYSSLLGWKIKEEVTVFPDQQGKTTDMHLFETSSPGLGGAFYVAEKPAEQLYDLNANGKLGTIMYFCVDSVEESVKIVHASKVGGRVITGKTIIGTDKGYFAQFADPDGNMFGVWAMEG